MQNKILELKNINKSFEKDDGSSTQVLDNINIEFKEGEIVGIIGRSGCGKSTLLRLITGLIPITSGEILFNNKPINNETAKISMVFQTFGLFPWLTISENIALGLKNQGLDEETINNKVSTAIELVGLGGFEKAYPKEISGGMRQRVGFARSIAIDPEILILDEPFSALDYLTANILKSDLLDLWYERSVSSIKSIILVTHSIEEALTLCDRVIVLSSHPGRVIANIDINIHRPRDNDSKEFHEILDKIYSEITKKNISLFQDPQANLYMKYPQAVSISRIIGFIECLRNVFKGKAEALDISEELKLDYDTMTAITGASLLLKFIDIDDSLISLSSAGNIILDADDKARKNIIKEHLVNYVYLIKTIYHLFQLSPNRTISKKELLELIGDKFNDIEAEKILSYTINWTRYAGLFNYDNNKNVMYLHAIKSYTSKRKSL